MGIFIKSAAAISPQNTFIRCNGFLNELIKYNDNRLTSLEPDYRSLIDPKAHKKNGTGN